MKKAFDYFRVICLIALAAVCSRLSCEVWNEELVATAVDRWSWSRVPFSVGINQFSVSICMSVIALFSFRGIKASRQCLMVMVATFIGSFIVGCVVYWCFAIPKSEARIAGVARHMADRITCQRFLAAAESTWVSSVGKERRSVFLTKEEIAAELLNVWPEIQPLIVIHPSGDDRLLTIDFGGHSAQWGILVMSKNADERAFRKTVLFRKWCDRVFFFYEEGFI